MMHRNTYINGPAVLDATWQMRTGPALFVAGQISGVEGYVESAASGLMAGRNAAALVTGRPLGVAPRTTAIGALAYYVSQAAQAGYQPTNITFGIMEPLARPPRRRLARAQALAARALADLDGWIAKDEAAAAAVPRERPGAGEAPPGQTVSR
jgi:methylenetetrahydrofolate--tRNA-(uracil-5-)-methyltransferase